jgi:type 1 fimbria pilin
VKVTATRTRARTPLAMTLLLALALLLLAAPAQAANVVNVTIQIPATVYDNPCLGEPVALHGDLHLILNITTDSSGGYHFVSKWNASYSGTGLLSGATYTASESKQESWSASQLPASHTTTSVIKLISKGGAQNAYLYTTTTTTIDANGVPTVTVDSVSIDCRG